MFGSFGTAIKALIGRSARKMTPGVDGDVALPRLSRYYEQIMLNLFPTLHPLVDEGSLYVAQTATPGTGITLTSATGTTFSATQGIFAVNNLDVAPSLNGQGSDVMPLWLKLIITAAGTAGTDSHVASVLDIGDRASAGTATLVGKNASANYPANDEVTQIIAGVPTLAAATNQARNLGRGEVRRAAAPAYVAGDTILFLFGAVENVQAQSITATTASNIVVPMPPVVIPPGWSWALLEWMTARSAAQSAEIEFGYIKR